MKNPLHTPNIFSHIATMNYLPRWGVLLMDLVLCVVAYVISIAIGSSLFQYGLDGLSTMIWQQGLVLLIVQTLFFWCFHTYSGIIRYSTFVDIIKVLSAVFSCAGILLVTNFVSRLYFGNHLFLNTALLIYALLAFTLLFCLRVGVKTIYDSVMQGNSGKRRVFIYGTHSAGLSIAKMLRSAGADSEYRPVGFIMDAHDEKVYNLQGLTVYPLNEQLFEIMKQKEVSDVIISPIKMKELSPAKDLDIFLNHGIRILTTPFFTTWDKDDDAIKHIGQINTLKIEDLLERPTIEINIDNVSEFLSNKVVLITGAAGSIGSEIVHQVIHFHPSAIILYDQAESPLHDLRLDIRDRYHDQTIVAVIGDIRNRQHLEDVFREYKPDVVFHAAAYKHVPLMEEFPNEAIQTNVMGTKNVADLSVQYGVQQFVMISTDKAVNPTNIMGASKRIAEIYVQSLNRKLAQENPNCTKFITTRFGNVLGSNGSVIPYFKKQIAAGGPVTVTHPDIIRYFMTIPEAVTLVLEAATLGHGGEIFVFDMGHPVRILDLAKKMIRLAGYKPGEDIMITFTGLRPGEKLYEEVLNQKEKTLPTANEKIMIAKVRETEYDIVRKHIDHLIFTSHRNRPMLTVQEMKQIVPEFKSKNSIYEQLDK